MYQPSDKNNWSGRNDSSGLVDTLLWHQVVQCVPLQDLAEPKRSGQPILLGYRSDEGVRRNKGRVGAKGGPLAMRKAMSGFALHFDALQFPLQDAGDVIAEGEDLDKSHQELAESISYLLDRKYLPIVMGGGHEIAYGHYCGIKNYAKSGESIGVINLDAHFDLRPYPEGAHSGSPFRQILDDCLRHGDQFNYLPIGINPAGNQSALFKVMDQSGQSYIAQDQVRWESMPLIHDQVRTFASQVDHIYLTLDLDVMPAAFAPGVSAPAAFGVDPNLVREIVRLVFDTNKVISFDIAELNPAYDDGRTAKLAGSFIYDIVQQFPGRASGL